MKPELHALLSKAKFPRALSEVLYQYCSPAESIRKIDLLCGKRTAVWEMTCFIEARSQAEAHTMANRLGAKVFGDKCVFFEVPLARDFVCASSQEHTNGKDSPISVSCKCCW